MNFKPNATKQQVILYEQSVSIAVQKCLQRRKNMTKDEDRWHGQAPIFYFCAILFVLQTFVQWSNN